LLLAVFAAQVNGATFDSHRSLKIAFRSINLTDPAL
jgi:hypothetical protein